MRTFTTWTVKAIKHLDLPSLLGNLQKDEDGGIALYTTVLIGTMMGMIGLVIDGGSFFHLHSNLQEVADAAALAGAAELDGASDAITRATAAANAIADPSNANSNKVYWSNVAKSGVQITAPTFYSSLNPDTTTTDPKQALYIQVTTVTRQVAPSFLVLTRRSIKQTTSASAVAENSLSSGVCAPLQSFMCNPFEGSETNKGNANISPASIRRHHGSSGERCRRCRKRELIRSRAITETPTIKPLFGPISRSLL